MDESDGDMRRAVREQEARIRQLQTDAVLKGYESLKRAQDIKLAPMTLLATGVGATAALFGAAIALLKWIG
jgi:hypothetical protein